VLLAIGVAVAAEHVRHFRPRLDHGGLGGRRRRCLGWAGKPRQQI
jgi:hypothetical protein